jgi:hypothetical protein
MFLHPPRRGPEKFQKNFMRHYLDFSNIPDLPDECKVIHRPDPEIEITHGNHGVVGENSVYTDRIHRHHYPIRSYSQFENKARGHLALKRRRSICARWEKWYNALEDGTLIFTYSRLLEAWEEMIQNPNHKSLQVLLENWSTPEVAEQFKEGSPLPIIGQWPQQ